MFTNLFLNFLNAPASTGSIDVNLQSYNASSNVNLTLTATGLTSGMAPETCAYTAITQFNTQIIQYGLVFAVPQLSNEVPSALFRLSRTDHVIDFFSECHFNIDVTSNTTGAYIETTSRPILSTLTSFSNLVNLMALGAPLTDAEKITLLTVASGLITDYTNNLIVTAGFVQTYNGFYQRSFFLSLGNPVQSYDTPRVAPPGLYFYWWFIILPWIRWNLNPITSELYYQPNQSILNWPEPSSLNYQIKIGYTAGNFKIPPTVVLCLSQLAKAIINDANGVKSLKTGSFSVSFREKTPIQTALALMDDYVLYV